MLLIDFAVKATDVLAAVAGIDDHHLAIGEIDKATKEKKSENGQETLHMSFYWMG